MNNRELAEHYYKKYYSLGYSRISVLDLFFHGELTTPAGDKLPRWFDAEHLEPVLDIMDEILLGGPQS